MQKDNKILDDLARLASGAAGSVLEMRREMEAMLSSKLERLLAGHQASREEFELLREMVVTLRVQQENLLGRMDALERRLEKLAATADLLRK